MAPRQLVGLGLALAGLLLVVFGLVRGLTADGVAAAPSAAASLASPSASPSPSPPPAPTATPAPTVEPTPTLGEAEVRAFASALESALRQPDVDRLFAALHPATVERYGEAACRAYLATTGDATFAIVVTGVGEPAPWEYVTDGVSTTIPDAWEITARLTQLGTERETTLHFAPDGGQVRWFTDCGEPLAG